jgi:hypothetical protein
MKRPNLDLVIGNNKVTAKVIPFLLDLALGRHYDLSIEGRGYFLSRSRKSGPTLQSNSLPFCLSARQTSKLQKVLHFPLRNTIFTKWITFEIINFLSSIRFLSCYFFYRLIHYITLVFVSYLKVGNFF